MSSGPAFMAVQCYQCSTMQVKQEKKSSNKWRCVICNERQSVRKVFVRSFLARDVRGFVQKANATRQWSESGPFWPENDFETSSGGGAGHSPEGNIPAKIKKRNDWSEFHEPEEDDDDNTGGGMLEPGFVTELPKEMMKPKRKFSSPFCVSKGNTPSSSSCKRTRRPVSHYDGDAPMTEHGLSKAERVCKWNDYLEVEDSNDGSSERLLPNTVEWGCEGAFETHLDDEKVEEEIHPEFM